MFDFQIPPCTFHIWISFLFQVHLRSGPASGLVDSVSDRDETCLKEPVITSTHQLVFSKTAEGQPLIARTTYTRVEATIPDHSQIDQHSQRSLSTKNKISRSV